MKCATMAKHTPEDLRPVNLSKPHSLSVSNVKLVEGATSQHTRLGKVCQGYMKQAALMAYILHNAS